MRLLGTLAGLRRVLDRRDWVYALSLLAPLAIYNLGLKAVSVASREEEAGILAFLDLMRSDLLFNAGYAALWISAFAVARRGVLRGVVVALFHAVSLLVAAVTTVAFQYLQTTGSTLDYSVVVFYLATFGEIKQVVMGSTPAYAWIVLAVALLYVALGPWLAVRVISRRREGEAPARTGNVPRFGAAALGGVAVGLVSLSVAASAADANRSFSLSPVVNLALTGFLAADADELATGGGGTDVVRLEDMKLEETPETEKRNVVTIVLDSTPANATTPYKEDMETTPYLDELATKSLLVERAYTTIPHTSKAMTSINCGIYPDPETDIHEAEPDAVPARCLPELLGDEGYKSVWFQSATETFENRPQLVENLGYDDFFGLEDMDTEGFQRAGYLGYEDDIMLEPSKKWLGENAKKGPFLATYLTITAHHEYLAPTRYGRKDFAEDDVYNRFLNSVRYEDFFVENVIEQYKEMGLYEDTIFVIVGDHGEAFGEHEVKGHDGVPYEEGLRVPLIIHDPRRWESGERVEGPANHPDLAPTMLDMLGYETSDGEYPGSSVLDPPDGRTLFFGCRPDLLCTTSTRGDEKYIYNYGKKPDEFYDLGRDPLEKDNIADEVPRAEIEARREEVLEWRAGAAAAFDE